ncbi:hypothetical protein KB206_07650 [Microvirga sp. STS02]|uniref:M1 family aminopeptidase n=1 Tax=Hymenobacter negativus TaxID=2795026 RepID=UPI0018DB4B1C|nr:MULTISPECIES: M1 family aminopeptidase [Bacteria]MBH8568750.1 hypothetical protein [Hymenobacter negativus]MBR7208484.1 hypothetical protein [Microvirga sp. STS02]
MKFFLLLLFLGFFSNASARQPEPVVQLQVRVLPETHAFTCRYTLTVPANDTATTLALHLDRRFRIERVQAPRARQQRVARVYYPFFADTVQCVQVRYAARSHHARRITLTYSGVLTEKFFTAQVIELSGHTGWLPFRPRREYEPVRYALDVRTPPGYQVQSTTAPPRHGPGRWTFRGRTSAIEITALVGPHFARAQARARPLVGVAKAGPALVRADSMLLRQAAGIIGFYNRTIGRQDSIKGFTVFLPGTNRDAFGLLANATVITYSEFNAADRGDLLILAHEISHKWWGYGSVHDENDWLNEAFATYSSLLYLQARGDTAGYRAELAKRAATIAGTPPLLGFDRTKYDYPMYRRVIYNKGTMILAALHARLGTTRFVEVLAATAARQVSTTTAFLDVVAQTAGPDTRAWLLAELQR